MSQPSPQPNELEMLEKTLHSEVKTVNIRLREGEYQYGLAKAIASFELELRFPDAKDLVRKLFGEKRVEDQQFVSKIQTILKKMEKSGIVKILPKSKPWELQRYMLSSFRFQDVEKNIVVFATKSEVEKTRELIHSKSYVELKPTHRMVSLNAGILSLILVVIVAYATVLWTFTQPSVDLVIFASAFCVAAVFSIVLGILFSRKVI